MIKVKQNNLIIQSKENSLKEMKQSLKDKSEKLNTMKKKVGNNLSMNNSNTNTVQKKPKMSQIYKQISNKNSSENLGKKPNIIKKTIQENNPNIESSRSFFDKNSLVSHNRFNLVKEEDKRRDLSLSDKNNKKKSFANLKTELNLIKSKNEKAYEDKRKAFIDGNNTCGQSNKDSKVFTRPFLLRLNDSKQKEDSGNNNMFKY